MHVQNKVYNSSQTIALAQGILVEQESCITFSLHVKVTYSKPFKRIHKETLYQRKLLENILKNVKLCSESILLVITFGVKRQVFVVRALQKRTVTVTTTKNNKKDKTIINASPKERNDAPKDGKCKSRGFLTTYFILKDICKDL